MKGKLHFSKCCQNGTVKLNKIKFPNEFKKLVKNKTFFQSIRHYNNLHSFTHNFAKVDKKLLNYYNKEKYCYKVSGIVSHSIPRSLIPMEGQTPKFAQIHVFDFKTQLKMRQDINKKAHPHFCNIINKTLERDNPYKENIKNFEHLHQESVKELNFTPIIRVRGEKKIINTTDIGAVIEDIGEIKPIIYFQ